MDSASERTHWGLLKAVEEVEFVYVIDRTKDKGGGACLTEGVTVELYIDDQWVPVVVEIDSQTHNTRFVVPSEG